MANSYDFDAIKALLDVKVTQFNTLAFIQDDPILLPHQFEKKQDIEIIGLLISLIAWGKRSMILKNGKRLIELMDDQPFQFVQSYQPGAVLNTSFVHRTFNVTDLDYIFRGLHACYQQFDSLEHLFSLQENQSGVKDRIINFRNFFMRIPHEKRSEKHLANPAVGSAAKRINMFLRWMVRKDEAGVDFGIWHHISPRELYVPLDVHTGRIARLLGLINRKQNDWKTVESLMDELKKMDANDPSKYDFALFGLGVTGELDV